MLTLFIFWIPNFQSSSPFPNLYRKSPEVTNLTCKWSNIPIKATWLWRAIRAHRFFTPLKMTSRELIPGVVSKHSRNYASKCGERTFFLLSSNRFEKLKQYFHWTTWPVVRVNTMTRQPNKVSLKTTQIGAHKRQMTVKVCVNLALLLANFVAGL